jgi:hypothetical protein
MTFGVIRRSPSREAPSTDDPLKRWSVRSFRSVMPIVASPYVGSVQPKKVPNTSA